MLESIVRQQVVFYFVGAAVAFGIVSKLIAGISLKRLVRAASNMSKSSHALMRLVRAKFEHACMVSDKVQNVGAFVEKYLYEYRTLGIRLHSWRRFEKTSVWMCGVFTAAGTALAYYEAGPGELMYRCAALGAAGVAGLFLLYMAADERYQLDAAKMYMVDFLENTYAHRYEKTNQREIQVTVQRAAEDVRDGDLEDEPDFAAEASYRESQELEAAYREAGDTEALYGERGQQEIRCREAAQPDIMYREPAQPKTMYRESVQPEIPYREPEQPEIPYKDIPTTPDPMIPDPMIQPGIQPETQPGIQPEPQPVIQPTGQPVGKSASQSQPVGRTESGGTLRGAGMQRREEKRQVRERKMPEHQTGRMPETRTASSMAVQGKEEFRGKEELRGEEESSRKEARIREILEEFLA